MFRIISLVVILTALTSNVLSAQKGGMDNKKMEKIIEEEGSEIEGEKGSWQLVYQGRLLLILTDEKNNRMRIFSPIAEEENIDATEMRKMLIANFHSALDAKYSLYNGFVISTFTHPLKELTKNQFIDAMKQVTNLSKTFGTTYSSTDLFFGGSEEEQEKRINKSPSKDKKS